MNRYLINDGSFEYTALIHPEYLDDYKEHLWFFRGIENETITLIGEDNTYKHGIEFDDLMFENEHYQVCGDDILAIEVTDTGMFMTNMDGLSFEMGNPKPYINEFEMVWHGAYALYIEEGYPAASQFVRAMLPEADAQMLLRDLFEVMMEV